MVAPGFLDGMAATVASSAEAAFFESLLRDCFGAMRGFDFAHPEKHGGALRRCSTAWQKQIRASLLGAGARGAVCLYC